MGQSEIGSVTFESAAYVARYILKKHTGKHADRHYEMVDPVTGEIHRRNSEYTTMSRRPGIGKTWFDKYNSEVYPYDEVIVRGKAVKPPKYYDRQYEIIAPEEAKKLSARRRKNIDHANNTPKRLRVREVCAIARANKKERET